MHSDRYNQSLSIKRLNYGYNKRLPTHPGDILKEELECRRISQKKFSEILGVPYTMLNEILNGKRPITSDFALMIEAALNINPELLINMQARYNMALAREKKALSNRLNEIRKCVPHCYEFLPIRSNKTINTHPTA